ncbi:hypothetical protein CGG92_25250 [Vibrio parahaemolyticus]|uniref:hypothetical protein n=1 Tax=Vibrio parahaemolyticus TaxID=670 RepID=UPI001122847B|nr:hypothetical protein [Vibrio parahaemolyticus]MDF4269737.1 hypothetical protein [Vibrio parahaemolyticus]MDF4275073.1 hypothetical protein [Vibrio parahaemolyticus]MDF4299665.1 hypothetical protein [Vibrio parahaemolyticus]TOH11452.1 hypothetical protein CGI87_24550 [Vibrio parahaemolyticus]TOQ56140.1 hypothetical protein CGG92_25250 [Vibrio parahaemolyticus]
MTKKGDATILFLKHKDAIEKRLSELYFIKNTYIEFKERGDINFTYEQFRTLCNKFILNKQKETPNNKRPSVQPLKTTPPSVKPNKPPQVSTTKSNTDEKPRDPFRRKTKPIHNPSMTPERRKELFG